MRVAGKSWRNTPITVAEAQDRLLAYGLMLVSHHENNKVTTETEVTVSCAAGHTAKRKYGNIRNRGCGECKAPFGERLLYALLRHYTMAPDDWVAKVVRGLDPTYPKRKLIFDVASESRKIAIENHSEYHLENSSIPHFEIRMSKEERLRLDGLKVPRVSKGEHLSGPIKGWKVGVVWFEAKRIAKLNAGEASYLPKVIVEFKELCRELSLPIRNDGIEIDAATIYFEIGKSALARVSTDFELVGPWFERSRDLSWRHICGGKFKKPILELENIPPGATGCPFCDKENVQGRWLAFLERLEEQDYYFAGENRCSICKEKEQVPIRCAKHPAAIVSRWTRSKWYQWLGSLKEESKVSFPPPCPECAATHTKVVQERERLRRKNNRMLLDDRLRVWNFQLVSTNPTTLRNPLTNKVIPQKSLIRCLNPSCGVEREIFVAQELKKAEARQMMYCPGCRPSKKGPKSKE